jgi:hypothetical protein
MFVEIAALFHWTWTEVSQVAVILAAVAGTVTLTVYGAKRLF